MEKTTVITNPSFHLKAGGRERSDAEFLSYRKRWSENPERDIVDRFPIHLDIESTSACNLRCPMCFQARAETRPEYGMMSMELFRRIIDEGTRKGLASIKLQYRGEPLMSSSIEEMVAYARNKGVVEVMFNTNATLLDEERARKLVQAGLDRIICSIDGHTPEVYNAIRVFPHGPGEFDTVLKNIRGLRRIRDELGSETPFIRVQMVDMPENRNYVQEYTKFWLENGADAVAVDEHMDYFSEFVELSRSREEAEKKVRVYPEFRCEQPWQRLFVLYSGKVTMCCGDHYHHFPLGMLVSDEQRAAYLEAVSAGIAAGRAEECDGWVEVAHKKHHKEISKFVASRGGQGQLEFVGVRDEYDNLVRAVPDIESIWLGMQMSDVRDRHRAGQSHEIDICASCSLRDATHRAYLRHSAIA